MTLYIILAILPVFSSWFFKDLNANEKSRKKYLILMGIILMFVTGLRSRFLGSTDTYNYYNYYKNAVNAESWSEFVDLTHETEIGFQIFNFVLSRVFKDPQWIIVFSSLIIISCALYSIHKNSKDIAFSVTMYITLGMWQFQIQGMRQAIAMSILLLSYECIKNRKYVKFILLVALATTFHVTAFVFGILLVIPFLKNIINTVIVSLVFGLSMFLFADDLIGIANSILDTEYGTTAETGGFIATAIYVLILVFVFLFNKNIKTNKNENAILFVTFTGAICYILRYFGALAAERISFYFMFGQMILLPNSMEFLNEKEKRFAKVVVYILMVGLFVYRLNSNETAFLPYRFFWETR